MAQVLTQDELRQRNNSLLTTGLSYVDGSPVGPLTVRRIVPVQQISRLSSRPAQLRPSVSVRRLYHQRSAGRYAASAAAGASAASRRNAALPLILAALLLLPHPWPPAQVSTEQGGGIDIKAFGSTGRVVAGDIVFCRGIFQVVDKVLLPIKEGSDAAAAAPEAGAGAAGAANAPSTSEAARASTQAAGGGTRRHLLSREARRLLDDGDDDGDDGDDGGDD